MTLRRGSKGGRATLAVVVAVAAAVAMIVALAAGHAEAYIDDGTRTAYLWPPVKKSAKSSTIAKVDPCTFAFIDNSSTPASGKSGIPTAINLYKPLIFPNTSCSSLSQTTGAGTDTPADQLLSGLVIVADNPEITIPTLGTSERYVLQVPVAGQAYLTAATYAGVLRGLETFSQLVLHGALQPRGQKVWHVTDTPLEIDDQPQFPHRGVLIDVARTFLPLDYIQRIIDGLMYSKLNVLHIHLTDSQSFPVALKSNPDIALHGAYAADKVYSTEQLRALVDYAAERGVRILPEIDSPGHTRAFGLAPGYTDIISCPNKHKWGTFCNEPPCGQLNIVNNHMYQVLEEVTAEFMSIFPDSHYHVGFDEINFNCWNSDPSVKNYLKEHNTTINDVLVTFFEKQRAMFQGKRSLVYWEEAVNQDPPLQLTNSDTVQIWGDSASIVKVLNATDASLLLSPSDQYYLDCGGANLYGDQAWCSPYKTWWHMYSNDYLNGTTPDNVDRILGGESCNWSEVSGTGNTMSRIFPRAGAYGARLWLYDGYLSRETAILSMASYQAKLEQRGIDSEGVTTHFCIYEPDLCYQQIVTPED